MALATYSPKDVIVSIAGLHTVTGYADGTFVQITKEMKPFEKVRAMDGEISRIYSEDEVYQVKLTLAQSSGTHNILSMLYNIDKATRMGKFPIIIKDTKGQTNFAAGTAWIEQIPDVTFSTTLQEWTWTFGCSDVIFMIGGNQETSTIEDSLLVGTAAFATLTQFMS